MVKGNKIEKLNNHKQINLGLLIFIVLFLYIAICLIINSKEKNITGYQVKTGMLAENRIYTGIALRDEHIVTSDYTGYVSYFINEGERTSYNNLVYCIDETGKLSDLTGKDPTDDNSLSASELTSFRQEIQLFSKNFNDTVFSESIIFENRINNSLSQINNRKIIDNLSSISSMHSNDIIDYCRARKPGIVLFYEDGYENNIASDLSKSDFDMENYKAKEIFNDDLIEAGSFVYKYVFDEDWSLVLCMPLSELARFEDDEYVEVKFSKTQTTSWARVNVISKLDDYAFVELSFTNSMISFCKDRFVEVELLLEEDTGLKIPNSSIAERSFYLIDKPFIITSENTSTYGVLRREYGENMETIAKYVEVNVIKEDEDVYYIDTTSLNYGDVLIKTDVAVTESDADSTFVVGKQGTLIGVYSINRGYAEFKRIDILYSNDEYTIIKPNASFGLRAYDYIALDGSKVSNKDFVY